MNTLSSLLNFIGTKIQGYDDKKIFLAKTYLAERNVSQGYSTVFYANNFSPRISTPSGYVPIAIRNIAVSPNTAWLFGVRTHKGVNFPSEGLVCVYNGGNESVLVTVEFEILYVREDFFDEGE